jgi:hypothetical protein
LKVFPKLGRFPKEMEEIKDENNNNTNNNILPDTN